MNLNDVLMYPSAVQLASSMVASASGRAVQALAAAVMDQEAPALLDGLRSALEEAQAQLPALEVRDAQTAAELSEQSRRFAKLSSAADAIPDGPATRHEHRAAVEAMADCGRARNAAEVRGNFAAGALREQLQVCRELKEKIAAIEALPAPDAAVLAAIRGAVWS